MKKVIILFLILNIFLIGCTIVENPSCVSNLDCDDGNSSTEDICGLNGCSYETINQNENGEEETQNQNNTTNATNPDENNTNETTNPDDGENQNDCVDSDHDGFPVSGSCLGNREPDCDDNNPYIFAKRMCYLDEDHDGFGAGTEKVETCVGIGSNNHNDFGSLSDINRIPGCSVPMRSGDEYELVWHPGAQGYYDGEDKSEIYAGGWDSSPDWQYSENNWDCAPQKPEAHPWTTYFSKEPLADGTYDFDCDGKVTKYFSCYNRLGYGDITGGRWSGDCEPRNFERTNVELCINPSADNQKRQWFMVNGDHCLARAEEKVWLCSDAQTVSGNSIDCGETFYMTMYHQYHKESSCSDPVTYVMDTSLMYTRYIRENNLQVPLSAEKIREINEMIRNGTMPIEYAKYTQSCR